MKERRVQGMEGLCDEQLADAHGQVGRLLVLVMNLASVACLGTGQAAFA